MKKKTPQLIFIFLILVPSLSLADAGTPLMWAGAIHLLIGNALIGVFEGLLLAKFFKVRKRRAIVFMIPANYFSAWVGVFILAGVQSHWHLNLYNAWRFLWFMVGFTYLLTLILELPFFAFCFWKDTNWFQKSIKATLLLVTASYVILFSWYYMASAKSLYTDMHIVQFVEISHPKNVFIYYISPKGVVKSRFITDTSEHTVCDIKSTNIDDRLFFRKSSTDSTQWELVARLETEDYKKPKFVVVQPSFAKTDEFNRKSYFFSQPWDEGIWGHGPVPCIGIATTSSWEFWNGFWAAEGLYGENKQTGIKVGFAYETPFGEWSIQNATQLPNDDVLFQLGDDQICILDPKTKQVALVCYGRGPVAILK